ncbi:MAG TPA: site-2 protease family protein, partial [Thermoleophilaceae bacterium]
MFGGGSIQLARVFGVRIGVDPSWFFVLFLIIWSLSGYYDDFALAVISALLFFLSIVLHELGHAVVAMRNGIPILGIDLWMFGGVAKMSGDTQSPGVEFRVAAAGPLVTLAIVGVCLGLGSLIAGGHDALQATRFEGTANGATAVLGYLASINALVLVFNLIPGFPLDGGRIARAIVWWRTGDRNRATLFAARLGRGFAFLMIGVGGYILLRGGDAVFGIWLAFIGIFLSQAARGAEVESAIGSRIDGLKVSDVMDAEPVAVPEDLPLDRAENEFFLRYGWPWFPVVDARGRLVGLLSHEAVTSLPEAVRPGRAVGSVMARTEPDSGLRVQVEEPLETLLSAEGLGQLGALLAVDAEGVLRG